MSYEEKKEQLKKTMSIKMAERRKIMSIELQSEAQMRTSTLVKRHSAEMLEFLLAKQEELKRELEDELVYNFFSLF